MLSGVIAVVIVGPLLALPASFLGEGEAFDQIARTLLPDALAQQRRCSRSGVGVGTLVIGGGLALLVSFYDFPGRRWLDWALVLPMAMPGYVLVFVVLGQYDLASPLQSSLFGGGLRISGIRTPLGAICILTAVLYPVRVRARSQRVPRPVAPDARSGAFARPHLRAVGPPGRVAARPSRARRPAPRWR